MEKIGSPFGGMMLEKAPDYHSGPCVREKWIATVQYNTSPNLGLDAIFKVLPNY